MLQSLHIFKLQGLTLIMVPANTLITLDNLQSVKVRHLDNVLVLLVQQLNLLITKQQNDRAELLSMQSD